MPSDLKTSSNKFVLALDQGPSSSRALVFNRRGEVVAQAQKPLTQHYPQPGWVEHDALEIWQSQLSVAKDVIDQIGSSGSIITLGITNQRETTVIWHRKTDLPIHRALVWQDQPRHQRQAAKRVPGLFCGKEWRRGSQRLRDTA